MPNRRRRSRLHQHQPEPRRRSPWYRESPVLLAMSAAILAGVLVAGYAAWSATSGPAVDEIVVTAVRPSAILSGAADESVESAEVAAVRNPEVEAVISADAAISLGWTETVVPDLLLRGEPTIEAAAQLQLAAGTPVEVLDGNAEADGYEWVRVRVEDGTEGWLIAEGLA
jgi:Bacterial SH3 domain